MKLQPTGTPARLLLKFSASWGDVENYKFSLVTEEERGQYNNEACKIFVQLKRIKEAVHRTPMAEKDLMTLFNPHDRY